MGPFLAQSGCQINQALLYVYTFAIYQHRDVMTTDTLIYYKQIWVGHYELDY